MKFKKSNLIKTLALTGSLGVIAATPIVATSCTSNYIDMSYNNTLQNNNAILNEKVNLNYNAFALGSKTLNEDLTTILNNNPEKLIQNYQSISATSTNINITVKNAVIDNTNTSWGENDFSKWTNPDLKNVYYNSSLGDITISNPNDLHTKLSTHNWLMNKIKDSSIEFQNITSANLVQDSNYYVDLTNDLIHTNVEVELNSIKQLIDFQIPLSSINYEIKSAVVDITGKNLIGVTNSNVDFVLNFGINLKDDYNLNGQSETVYADLDESNNPILEQVLSGLKWTKKVQNETVVNSVKIQEQIGLFNVEFTPISITRSIADSNINYFDITLSATPYENQLWADGTSEAKEIVVHNIFVNTKGAELTKEYYAFTGSSYVITNTPDVNAYFKDAANINRLTDVVNTTLTQEKIMKNATAKYMSFEITKHVDPNNPKNDVVKVNFVVSANNGFVFEDKTKAKTFSAYFVFSPNATVNK